MAKNKLLTLPLLPLRDQVIFPYMMIPIFIGREKSINALEKTISNKTDIILASQKQAKINDPSPDQIYKMGTLASIVQHLRLPDGTVKTILEGKQRVKIKKYLPDVKDCLMVEVEPVEEDTKPGMESEALLRTVYTSVENYIKFNKHIPSEAMAKITTIDDCGELADVIASQLNLRFEDKQRMLETVDASLRLKEVLKLITREIQILKVERKIRTRVKEQMERSQKEYYLNEQLQAIQKELGDKDFHTEVKNLEEKAKTKKWSPTVAKRFKKEIQKLKIMMPMSAEATVVRNYVEWFLDLPWEDFVKEKNSLSQAKEILDKDHWGLKKVKERILEYLAVRRLSQHTKSPVICFVGPPGVGKTSLAQSIARCLNRPFARISLGGVQDEAELRGHRKTYVGSMPGKIIQALKKVKKGNPVILLDEVDKMGLGSFRGDPSSALLEVLDPEQNHTFQDHYLEVDYNLSSVLFVCTANSVHTLKGPLLDRMELIPIEGYIEEEKTHIAKRHLIPRQQKRHGLLDYKLELSDSILKDMIAYYTKEAGVRQLERTIASVFRKFAKDIVIQKEKLEPEETSLPEKSNPLTTKQGFVKQEGLKTKNKKASSLKTSGLKSKKINPVIKLNTRKELEKLLGPKKFRFSELENDSMIGLTNGLAWTETGGDTLAVETLVVPGTGKYTLTGQLGDVMKESCSASLSFVRSLSPLFMSPLFNLKEKYFKNHDFHIHVPEGAIPKDGPSAGVAIITSLVSAILKIPVKNTVAMTGEITLRGRVLPIGGLKEKILAAHRAHIKTVIIPLDNKKDLKDIPDKVLKDVKVIPVEQVDKVLTEALEIDSADTIFKDLRKSWIKKAPKKSHSSRQSL